MDLTERNQHVAGQNYITRTFKNCAFQKCYWQNQMIKRWLARVRDTTFIRNFSPDTCKVNST
jgi:hypothetical protein